MPEHKISNMKAGFMMSVALLFDGVVVLLNLIPVVGTVLAILVNIVAFATFWLWFALNGVVLFRRPRRLIITLVSAAIEMFPVVNALPAWTFWVWRITLTTRVKERVTRSHKSSPRAVLREARKKQQKRRRREEARQRRARHQQAV